MFIDITSVDTGSNAFNGATAFVVENYPVSVRILFLKNAFLVQVGEGVVRVVFLFQFVVRGLVVQFPEFFLRVIGGGVE